MIILDLTEKFRWEDLLACLTYPDIFQLKNSESSMIIKHKNSSKLRPEFGTNVVTVVFYNGVSIPLFWHRGLVTSLELGSDRHSRRLHSRTVTGWNLTK